MNCKNCGIEMSEGTEFCLNCGVNQSEIKTEMGWYAFLTYFSMPFSAICATFAGIFFMPNVALNIIYRVNRSEILNFIFLDRTEIKILLFVAGIIEFAFAGYYVYITYSLAKYKKKSLKHLCLNRIVLFVFTVVFTAVLLILMRDNISTSGRELTSLISNFTSQLVSVIVWLWINIKYFNNRKHLFIN